MFFQFYRRVRESWLKVESVIKKPLDGNIKERYTGALIPLTKYYLHTGQIPWLYKTTVENWHCTADIIFFTISPKYRPAKITIKVSCASWSIEWVLKNCCKLFKIKFFLVLRRYNKVQAIKNWSYDPLNFDIFDFSICGKCRIDVTFFLF